LNGFFALPFKKKNWILRNQKSQVFCFRNNIPSCNIPLHHHLEQRW